MELTAAAEVQVTGPSSAVPEPGTLAFLGFTFAALVVRRARLVNRS
jgi:hypothetical protein